MSTNHSQDESVDAPVGVNWDERVESWEEVAASPAFLRLAQLVVEAAEPRSTDRVLDLGAGTGLLALALAPRVEHVLAVDLSEPMLVRLHGNALRLGVQNVSTRVADLRTIPLEDSSVTLAVSNYAFHHLDDAGKELALAEARRVLAPGGRLVICDMMFSLSLSARDRAVIAGMLRTIARRGPSGIYRIAKNAGRIATGTWEKPTTQATWEAMLKRRGFDDIAVTVLENEAGLACAVKPSARAHSGNGLAVAAERRPAAVTLGGGRRR